MAAPGRRTAKQRAGDAAEQLAAAYLERQGLAIVGRNYRCKGGEIDVIARDGATLVFVEVRLRRSRDFGGAGASIDFAKQRRVLLAAQHYLARHGEQPCRCDAILLDALDATRVEWLKNAITA
jgi:putative endonuclease